MIPGQQQQETRLPHEWLISLLRGLHPNLYKRKYHKSTTYLLEESPVSLKHFVLISFFVSKKRQGPLQRLESCVRDLQRKQSDCPNGQDHQFQINMVKEFLKIINNLYTQEMTNDKENPLHLGNPVGAKDKMCKFLVEKDTELIRTKWMRNLCSFVTIAPKEWWQ